MDREFRKDLFALQDMARQNSALVTRAAQFVIGERRDRYAAEALERVRGHVALPGRVAELASCSPFDIISSEDNGGTHIHVFQPSTHGSLGDGN
ncbi:hypothetical protein V5799_032766 [Amblyomma americanum]|uniref:Uncharacterized protein n=1 Tax=Amblyomma americanum TaxID=6943 RepID=A0AAQ4DQ86_AMBAM